MLTVAKRLIEDPVFENPTVLMLVDRNELEAQLFRNLDELGIDFVVVDSKRELQRVLRADRRGLIVSMIHKFDDSDADLILRANVFVLVDEAHRTTGGDLGSCSTAGRATFAEDLLAAPAGFRRKVIVHELLHLKVPNHGRLFKAWLRAYLGG